MADEKPPRTAAEQVATANWHEIGRTLAAAVQDLGVQMDKLAQRQREAREVGALFAYHHLYRTRPAGAPPRAESLAQLQAALDGYGPEYLEQLANFGAFLAEQAGRRFRGQL